MSTPPSPGHSARSPRWPVVVELATTLTASAPAVWARVTTPEGIQDELRPWVRMTMPPGLRGRTLQDAPALLDRPLGKAWLFLLGVLPVDYDDMRLVGYVEGRSFHERSRMLLLSGWEHERSVTPRQVCTDAPAGGCVVTDRLTATARSPLARIPGAAGVVRTIVTALFRHRHRRLSRRFGGPTRH
ncbi:hypothetical protein J2S59_003387 [Nocardioides massiliensis]|uniref:SRPBCC family protein n=2 Tax=Nocardioides massiliensis TaxID=1325935 RepID=A0ABT9NT57_9ACTN|nr:hypothetical protein [Nocardioides massiliensis]MDP9823578.1 hypothetical protein [Nocardioides massiliensis]